MSSPSFSIRYAVAALIVLASPVRAQQPADSADRADSVRDDSIWHARLRKLSRAIDTTRHADVAPPAHARARKTPVDTAARADVDSVQPVPVPVPVAAPVVAPVVPAAPPVRAEIPKAPVDTAARAHVDSVKPAPLPAPVAAPVVAPVVPAAPPVRAQAPKAPVDTAARAHIDIKPVPVLAPVAAPVAAPAAAPVVQADTLNRARMDSIQQAKWGQYVWKNRQCAGCHELGRDQSSGPNLVGVTDRRPVEWLRNWLKNPAAMTGDDPAAMALKKKYGSQMPNLQLSTRDIEGLIVYLARETQARAGR